MKQIFKRLLKVTLFALLLMTLLLNMAGCGSNAASDLQMNTKYYHLSRGTHRDTEEATPVNYFIYFEFHKDGTMRRCYYTVDVEYDDDYHITDRTYVDHEILYHWTEKDGMVVCVPNSAEESKILTFTCMENILIPLTSPETCYVTEAYLKNIPDFLGED